MSTPAITLAAKDPISHAVLDSSSPMHKQTRPATSNTTTSTVRPSLYSLSTSCAPQAPLTGGALTFLRHCWLGPAAGVQVPQLRLEVALEPGPVLALERAQLLDPPVQCRPAL